MQIFLSWNYSTQYTGTFIDMFLLLEKKWLYISSWFSFPFLLAFYFETRQVKQKNDE